MDRDVVTLDTTAAFETGHLVVDGDGVGAVGIGVAVVTTREGGERPHGVTLPIERLTIIKVLWMFATAWGEQYGPLAVSTLD